MLYRYDFCCCKWFQMYMSSFPHSFVFVQNKCLKFGLVHVIRVRRKFRRIYMAKWYVCTAITCIPFHFIQHCVSMMETRALQLMYELKVVPFMANKSKKSSSPNPHMHKSNSKHPSMQCACIRSKTSERGVMRKHSGNIPLFIWFANKCEKLHLSTTNY